MAPLIGFDLIAEGARSKKDRGDEDAPAQVPMRPEKMARNPSTDQKRVRRQMARQATAESGTTDSGIPWKVDTGADEKGSFEVEVVVKGEAQPLVVGVFDTQAKADEFLAEVKGHPQVERAGIATFGAKTASTEFVVGEKYRATQPITIWHEESSWGGSRPTHSLLPEGAVVIYRGVAGGLYRRGEHEFGREDIVGTVTPLEALEPLATSKWPYTSSKESTQMDTSIEREAQLLAAMAKANLDEQRQLAADLSDLRMARHASLTEERETDIANAFIRDTLTPVATHVIHTASTDWLDEVADYGTDAPETMTNEVTSEATLWFQRVHTAVKADREEFAEQALGMARRTASKFGPFADAARAAFLERIAFLHKQAEDATDGWGETPGQQKDDTDPWTEKKTTGDSQDLSELPGVASALDDEFAFVAADADRSSYPAHEQAGYGESGLPVEPTGEDTEKTFDEVINGDLEETGPYEVPSTRAPNISSNSSLRVTAARSLATIADEIAMDWKNVYFGAVPYLQAMADLDTINDRYYAEDARMIVNYFLSNATSWRGDKAREIKAELKAMLKTPRTGAAHVADNGNADSGLKDVEVGDEDDRPMWPWEMPEADGGIQNKDTDGKDAADVDGTPTPGKDGYPQPKKSAREVVAWGTQASEGQTCGTCGAPIEKDPSGEDPSTWHHNDGSKHDHEATPGGGDSKESKLAAFRAQVQASLGGAR